MLTDDWWQLTVPANVIAYSDVDTVEDYLNRVARVIEPEPAPFASASSSPFTIPDMVSYLDAVWAARFRAPLFSNLDPRGAVSLVSDAQTPDEFDVRCSALADVLAKLDVPGDDTLQRKGVRPAVLLGQWLAKRLDDGPASRVREATSVLSRIVNIRVGGQHSADRRKAVDAFDEFGLNYPPTSWPSAWSTVREAAVGALDAILQEVRASGLTEADLQQT